MAACASGARTASAVTSSLEGSFASATASTLTSVAGTSSFALQPVNRVLAASRIAARLVVLFRIMRISSYGSFRRITEGSLRQLSCQGLQLSQGNATPDPRIHPRGLRCAVEVLLTHNLNYS